MPLPKGSSLFYRSSKKRWVLSYADPVRGQPQKVLPKEITRQRDAEEWAVEWLRAENLRPDLALAQRRDDGMTVAACAEKWLHLRERDERVAPATLDGNRQALHNWILPRFAAQSLGGLEVPELRAFLRDIRSQRAGSTVRNIYYTFSTMYADAMAEGWINVPKNVLQHPGVQREIPDLNTRRVAVRLPLEWAAKLINGPMVEPEWRARYALAFTSGARDGEIAGLRWFDLEFESNPQIFRIEQSVAVVGQKTGVGFAKPKNTKTKQSKRTMPLHAAACDALLAWREHWTVRFGRAPGPNDYVFPGAHGNPTRPRSAQQMRQHLELLGLPTEVRGVVVDFKATRSSFASWLADAGVPDQIRKRLMGHAVRDVTEWHYTARDIEQLAAAVAKIELRWESAPSSTSPESPSPLPLPTHSDARQNHSMGTSAQSRRPHFRKPLATQKPLLDTHSIALNVDENNIQAQGKSERSRIPKPLVASSILAGGANDFGHLADQCWVKTNRSEPCCPHVAQTFTPLYARPSSSGAP